MTGVLYRALVNLGAAQIERVFNVCQTVENGFRSSCASLNKGVIKEFGGFRGRRWVESLFSLFGFVVLKVRTVILDVGTNP
jgi:hypothetical protein